MGGVRYYYNIQVLPTMQEAAQKADREHKLRRSGYITSRSSGGNGSSAKVAPGYDDADAPAADGKGAKQHEGKEEEEEEEEIDEMTTNITSKSSLTPHYSSLPACLPACLL